jgi:hypothetical protein
MFSAGWNETHLLLTSALHVQLYGVIQAYRST